MPRHTRVLADGWQMRPVHRFNHGDYPPATHPGWYDISLPFQWQQHPDLQRYVGPTVYRTTYAHTAAPDATERVWLRLNGVF